MYTNYKHFRKALSLQGEGGYEITCRHPVIVIPACAGMTGMAKTAKKAPGTGGLFADRVRIGGLALDSDEKVTVLALHRFVV